MIDLYMNDRKDERIMAAVETLQRYGYHVVRPERFAHVYAVQRCSVRDMEMAPRYHHEHMESWMAQNIAAELAKAHIIEINDVSTKEDRDSFDVVFRGELRAVLPIKLNHPYTGEPLLNAVGRLPQKD